ncbi:hypothetical protein C7212DRAFT_328582, partial [Tuber magnatum]
RGFCGRIEREIRCMGKELIEKGWEIRLKWIPGHMGLEENEEADERKRRKRTLGEEMEEQLFILDENGSWEDEGSKAYRRKGEM